MAEQRGDRAPFAAPCGGGYGVAMLTNGDAAPDFAIGETTLFRLLERGSVAVFFFPKAFTPG